MTRITITQPAGDFEVAGKGLFAERFASDAFASQVGKVVPFTYEGRQFTMGTLTAAEVSPDGSSALLTFDLPDDAASAAPRLPSGMSFGFTTPRE